MRKNNHYNQRSDKIYIEISSNISTLKSEMFISDTCDIDYRRYNSINSLLGFDSKLYTSGCNESENMVNILLSTAYSSILILFQVVMLMVPHNPQFTRSSRCLTRV